MNIEKIYYEILTNLAAKSARTLFSLSLCLGQLRATSRDSDLRMEMAAAGRQASQLEEVSSSSQAAHEQLEGSTQRQPQSS